MRPVKSVSPVLAGLIFLLLVVIGIAASLLASGDGRYQNAERPPTDRPVAISTWAKFRCTLQEALADATDIVVARVISVSPAPPYIQSAPGEPGGKVEIPNQRVVVQGHGCAWLTGSDQAGE